MHKIEIEIEIKQIANPEIFSCTKQIDRKQMARFRTNHKTIEIKTAETIETLENPHQFTG